jgi:hypothetical protein
MKESRYLQHRACRSPDLLAGNSHDVFIPVDFPDKDGLCVVEAESSRLPRSVRCF